MERPIYFDNIYDFIYDLGLSIEDSHLVFNLLSEFFGNQKIIKYHFIIDEKRWIDCMTICCSEESIKLLLYIDKYLKDVTGYNDDEYGLDYVIIGK